jgi:hypothetical protein
MCSESDPIILTTRVHSARSDFRRMPRLTSFLTRELSEHVIHTVSLACYELELWIERRTGIA